MRGRARGGRGCGAVVGAVIVLAAAASCGRPSTTADSRQPPVELAQYFVEPFGVQPDQLPDPQSEGARLAAEFCSQCHGIPAPSAHSATDWSPILRNMFLRTERMARMGMMGGMMGGMMMRPVSEPSVEEERAILAYYQAHALHAIPEGAAAPTAGPGRELFAKECARCHALPDPGAYPAAQWPAVVSRMRQHMSQMHLGGITDQQAGAIVGYLEKASSAGASAGR